MRRGTDSTKKSPPRMLRRGDLVLKAEYPERGYSYPTRFLAGDAQKANCVACPATITQMMKDAAVKAPT